MPIVTDGKDGNGLKRENAGRTFPRFDAMPAKITKNDDFYGQCSGMNNSTGAFCVWLKVLSFDLSTEMT